MVEQRGATDAGGGGVGAVDVEPEVLGGAEVGDLGQGIDGAGVGGAGVGDDRQGQEPGGAVGLDGAGQFARIEALAGVGVEAADAIADDPQRARGAVDRGMGLVGAIEHRAGPVGFGESLAGDGQGGEVGQRAAADEQPAGAGRHPA